MAALLRGVVKVRAVDSLRHLQRMFPGPPNAAWATQARKGEGEAS